MSPQTLHERLESLYRNLEGEGWHVHANTVALALEAMEDYSDGVIFTEIARALFESEPARLSIIGNLSTFQRFRNHSGRKLEEWEINNLRDEVGRSLDGVYRQRNKPAGKDDKHA